MKHKTPDLDDDLRPEYDFDFSKGEKGRYYKRLIKEGSNNVVLDPDIARAFPDSMAVNNTLRAVLELIRASSELTGASVETDEKGSRGRRR